MANDLNRWTGIGRLGKDVELRYFASGDAVANISIACSESWKDKQTGEAKERTEWVPLVLVGKLAEVAGQYLRKGSRIYVEGKFTTRKWEKDGQTHYTTEIRVDRMLMLDGKPADGEQRQERPARAAAAAPAPSGGGGFVDDDIPFAPRHWKEG